MAFCTNCGKELPVGSKFCANCGTSVEQIVNGVNQEEYPKNAEEVKSGDYSGSNIANSSTNGRDKETKKSFPIIGIIALVLAVVGFFGDPPALTIIVSVIAIIMSIVSFVRKDKLKGFAIIAIVISVLSLIITAIGGINQSSGNPESEELKLEKNVHDNKELEYSINGITFTIPSKYVQKGNSFESLDKNIAIYFQDAGSSVTNEQFDELAEELDKKMDNLAEELLENSYRKSALSSEVASFKTRSYCYSGKINGEKAVAYFELINVTEKEKCAVVMAVATEEKSLELDEDYKKLLELARYTNASDTISTSNSSEKINAPDGVSPDLVAFLDEYESFVDEYVDFMQKYYANPTDLGLLSDYADIMQEYSDFTTKIDAYDSNSMSTADASYYLEVTTRCTQKMLKVLDSMDGE